MYSSLLHITLGQKDENISVKKNISMLLFRNNNFLLIQTK